MYGLSASLIASGSVTTGRLQHHLALVVHHAKCGFVHANIQSREEFHTLPLGSLNATKSARQSPRRSPQAQPQPRPIAGGIPIGRCQSSFHGQETSIAITKLNVATGPA